MGCMPLRCRPIHAYKVHAGETHAHEVRAYEGFMRTYRVQLQLGFWRRHTLGSVSSHMGFSYRRGVLKATI